ncbi:MAG TPA: FAD-dependent oxidoreductase [Acidimicrobiia bacterium]|jgi:thioredoxin reductase|nr:FAD-dependent oxidoreductase [Acidimicrobiia bacterium]
MGTIVIGDGPGGLSAALFLAKNGHEVTVFGQNETAMHHALLFNYLGVEEILGSDLQAVGRRQVESFGGRIRDAKVTSVGATGAGFEVAIEDGEVVRADYLVMTEGRDPALARSLGVAESDGGIVVDRRGRSSVDRVYVIGRSVRPERSQAIISAGDGAAAALDILSREAGKDVRDWDSPPKE